MNQSEALEWLEWIAKNKPAHLFQTNYFDV